MFEVNHKQLKFKVFKKKQKTENQKEKTISNFS